ncbi:VWA domain-containing protein [Sulfurimonas sp. HSL-1716]|uniref:vWA domain-containing protein n=1 Tax=Hydrocurvibacter sulfurireducens TaxID=3131937 RepID=UPI0031F79B1D
MSFLYPWVYVALIPIYLLYKKSLNNSYEAHFFEEKKTQKRQIKYLYLALVLMLAALSRPVIENSFTDEKSDAQEYIIAIDASYSMQADDIKPSRYEAAKEVIKQLFALHPKDRFTIFAFTSNTLLISPPTTDSAISINALDALNPSFILTKSTDLKQMFQTIAKVSRAKKKLIVFSDGGDEKDLKILTNICKKSSIIPYIVASASKNGTALKKDGRYIKDQYSSLVISRINPILEELAAKSGGKYYELGSSGVVQELSDDISSRQKSSMNETVKVKSYKELFYIPLLLAVLFFFAGVTKIHQLYVFVPLLLLPDLSHAGVLDFYHLKKADESFKRQKYLDSAKEFEKVTPSVKSYYNTATAYYKAGHYKKALQYFDMIQTTSKEIKQKILYDMAGCAVKLKKYDRAEIYYQQALALGKDEDALYNLTLLQKLNLKTGVNISDMLPPKNAQTKKNSTKKTGSKKDENKEGGGKSNSNQQADQSSEGAGDAKKGDMKKAEKSEVKQIQKNKYKMGYRSYEMINKGYTDEKEPW